MHDVFWLIVAVLIIVLVIALLRGRV